MKRNTWCKPLKEMQGVCRRSCRNPCLAIACLCCPFPSQRLQTACLGFEELWFLNFMNPTNTYPLPRLHTHSQSPLPLWLSPLLLRGQTEHLRALSLPISLPANEAQPGLLPLPPIPPYRHTSTSLTRPFLLCLPPIHYQP